MDRIVCDVGAIDKPDLAAVDALARIQLGARRCGAQVSLHNPCEELEELLTFLGLDEVLPSAEDSLEA